MHKNKNRGYQKLRVWKDAVEYYRQTWTVFRKFPYDLKQVGSQAIAFSLIGLRLFLRGKAIFRFDMA